MGTSFRLDPLRKISGQRYNQIRLVLIKSLCIKKADVEKIKTDKNIAGLNKVLGMLKY